MRKIFAIHIHDSRMNKHGNTAQTERETPLPLVRPTRHNPLIIYMNKINLTEKFSQIDEHWRPRVAAELNGQELRLVKFAGNFPWHHHEEADELFLVWRGSMTVEFRDRAVALQAGECCVVPRGVEHRTRAAKEAEVLIIEPAETRNTGNIEDSSFTAPQGIRV